MKIKILENQKDVARYAADLLCEVCARAVADAEKASTNPAAGGFINVALSGGTTPKALYQLLTREPWRGRLPWGKIRWFLGDERTVPLDHKDSNFRMVRENLFVPAGVPERLQFPVERCGVAPPEQVANDYETEVTQAVTRRTSSGVPVFDLMLLGVGTDGHTASLFPHTTALKPPPGKFVVANYVDKLKTWRITLTGDVIRSAENLIVMVTGEDKAEAIEHVIEGESDPLIYPAQLMRDLESAVWLLDKAAAVHLEQTA